MYAEDLAEFARVLLAITEMTFLAGITGNRPEALVELRYRHLKLTLIRDPDGGSRPRLFIELTPEFTKRYLGAKDMNEFKIPEIIYDPTLMLSPHVFLLGYIASKRSYYSRATALIWPYNLRDGLAKALNEYPDVSDSLQNKIL
ncbi:hypothetical protein WAI453_012700 [Rhynchosporium graminicola]